MGDPTADYFTSGGTTASPFDAANDANMHSSVAALSQDPTAAYFQSGGTTAHPLSDEGKNERAKRDARLTKESGEITEGPIGFVNGLAETAGKGILNIPHAAAHAGVDLYRRWTGGDTSAPDPSSVNSLSVPLSSNAQAASGAVGSSLQAAAQPYRVPAIERVVNSAPVQNYVAPVARDVGALAPVAGLARGVGGVIAEGRMLTPRPQETPLRSAEGAGSVSGNATAATDSARTPFVINDKQSASELGIKPERAEDPRAAESTGGLSAAQQNARKALARRLRLSEVRKSAIEGNAQDAADDFDSTKYTDDPTGERMRGVIANERQALVNHAEGIVEKAGGTPGTDQSSNITTGRTIAKPFDDLRDFINDQKTRMYAAGRERLGSAPITTTHLEAALDDPELKNSLLAQGKESLLKGAQAQLQHFQDNNGGGLNVATAEKYRQFVNTLWGTDKNAVGKLTHAIDNDVGGAVGEDVFAPARAMHGLGKDLLENPDGVSDLFDKDPRKGSPNRSTSFEDIPDKLANLDGAQFKNVLDTLDKMPEELQPQAQEAKAAIQAHMANRLLNAGSKSEGQWNKKAVNNELRNNSENFKTAFADQPDLAADIKDLKDGGEMLRYNAAYRGAHAQASNMLKQGIGAGAEWAGAGAGGAVGTFLGGPGIPTAAGAMAGKAAVAKGVNALKNRSLRKDVESRIVKLDQ